MNTAREVIDLKDSVELMNSADYKERFLAEYAQLSNRLVKLECMMYAWRNNKLEFTRLVRTPPMIFRFVQ